MTPLPVRARFCFKVRPTDAARRDFEAHFIPADSLTRDDGRVRVRRLQKALFRVPVPSPMSYCGGFLFWAGGDPWGFAEDRADFLPASIDYITYTPLWLRLACAMSDEIAGARRLEIHGTAIDATWAAGRASLRLVRPEPAGELAFEVAQFVAEIAREFGVYRAVQAELTRQLDYAWNDPTRREHIASIRVGVPAFDDLGARLREARARVDARGP